MPACLSTPWCIHLVEEVTGIYTDALALVGDSGVGAGLATLAYSASLVYIATACALDVTAGSDAST